MSRKQKDYDDDALVAAIAAGDKTYARIARRFGLNPTTVRRIALGRRRPELQQRIRAARPPHRPPCKNKQKDYDDEALIAAIGAGGTSYAAIARRFALATSRVSAIARGLSRPELRRRIHAAREKGQPMCPHKWKDYDDDALVEAIAKGEKSYAQIGREVGLRAETVAMISRGQRRPDLQPRVQAAVQGFIQRARRMGGAWAGPVMARHIKEGMEGRGETARKCREYVLNQSLGDPSRSQLLVNQQQVQEGLGPPVDPDLAAEYYHWVAEKHGWTAEDDARYAQSQELEGRSSERGPA